MEQNNKIILFQEKQIRRAWHDDQWFFSVVDVIEVLTGSPRPRKYWSALKTKLTTEGFTELSQNVGQLKMPSPDGKSYKTDVANTQTIFRLIMSIPSPNAEPFKQWLSQVGQERIEEIENPELAIERIKETYLAKGYPTDWVDTRIQSIEVRKQRTDEWQKRQVQEGREYTILTAEIAKATFGLTPNEHKNIKGLERQNLRDHMTTLELIFTQLGEEMTRKLAVEKDAQGFDANATAAKQGGRAAGDARKAAEKRTGVKVVSGDNFLNLVEEKKKKKSLKDDESQKLFIDK